MTTESGAEMRSRGMRDLLPDEMDRVRLVEDGFRRVCRSWGYREIRTPAIEPLHLFTAAGTLSPRMLDSVYSFLDWDGWSGERVVLRPDSTIPAARLYAETVRDGSTVRLFYCQSIYRFTTDASSREEWQCGVELIGDSGLAGDVELVLLALETLGALDLPPLTLRISHAGLVRAVLGAAGLSAQEQSAAYDRLLDGDLAVVGEIESRLPQLDAPLRLLFEVEGAGSSYIEDVRAALGKRIPALSAALDDLAFVVAALEARGVAVAIQSVLARSFEYYSGLVFKIYAAGERICSGGRYDGLVELIGGTPARASGFAHYVDPIVARLAPATATARNVDVVAERATPELIADTHVVAAQLRANGFVAATSVGDRAAASATVICRAANDLQFVENGHKATFATVEDLLAALEQRR